MYSVAPFVPHQTSQTDKQPSHDPTSTSVHQQGRCASQMAADALQPHTSNTQQLLHDEILSPQSLPLSHCQLATQPPFQNLSSPPPEQNEEWKAVHNPNKRDRNSPDNRNVKQTKISDYWLGAPVPTSNRFDSLGNDPEDQDVVNVVTDVRIEKSLNPPPIFVQGVQNITPLIHLLDQVVKDNYEIKALNFNQVKIQPKTTEGYTMITKALIGKGTEFYTYQLKNERNFRVVLKGMHYSTDLGELKAAI